MPMQFFLARQPIFDARMRVQAYELLYRSSTANVFGGIDGNAASSEVIVNSILMIGMDSLTRGKLAFINFTEEHLRRRTPLLLSKDLFVVEILEDVEPSEEILNECRNLKEQGYRIALDDFQYSPKFDDFIALADIIKVDFMLTKGYDREAVVQRLKRPGLRFLAEKVETMEDYKQAKAYGYELFQGYFFNKPVVISGRGISGAKQNYLQLIQEVAMPDLDMNELEEIIKRDVALSFKLLKFINSVVFSLRHEIRSIRQALVMLGQKEIVKWFSLILLGDMGSDKPVELMINATSRGIFCELVGRKVGFKEDAQDLFMMGLFSLIDVFLDAEMATILDGLPVSQEVKQALEGEGGPFRDILEMIVSLENARWDQLEELASHFNLTVADVNGMYLDAIKTANDSFIV
jgi:EAL and modified HD-GYP domain-containing signal transduction protein